MSLLEPPASSHVRDEGTLCRCASRQMFSTLPQYHPHKQKYPKLEQHPHHTSWENVALMIITTLAPAAVSAGINFAVAHVMYRNMPLIRFWPFPNTIAGDLVVTTFIQGTITYISFGATLSADIRRGSHVAWPLPSRPIFLPLPLPRHILPKSLQHLNDYSPSSHDILDYHHFSLRVLRQRFFKTLMKGLVCSFFLCLIIWPISVAILAPIYGGGRNMARTYTPQLIKLIYGFVLSAVQTPIVAFVLMNGLAAEREEMLVVEEHGEKEQEKLLNEPPAVPPTNPKIPSEAHLSPPDVERPHTNSLPSSRGRVVGTYRQRSATINSFSFQAFPEDEGRLIVAPPGMRQIERAQTIFTGN